LIRGLMTDDEWAYFEPFLIRRGGRPPRNHRRVLDAVFWLLRNRRAVARSAPALMHDIDCDPEQMLGDKGYDSEAVRRDIEQRGGEAVIPSLASRKIQHAVDKAVYALRNRIERFFNRAKNSRRVATRYDKLIESFAAFVLLTCIAIWVRFVHTTCSFRGPGNPLRRC
jgi:transposase